MADKETTFRWRVTLTPQYIEEVTGVEVAEIREGTLSVDGPPGAPPCQVPGIEITFAAPPPPAALEKLDVLFANYSRPGGTNIAAKLESLESQVLALGPNP